MRIIRNIIFFILVLFAGVIVFRNPIIQWTVSTVASQVTGAPVVIDRLAVGIVKPTIRIKGFRVYNPEGFPDGILLNMEELSVDYDLPSLVKGRLHLPLLVVHLKEAVIVKNRYGALNVDALKFAQKPDASSAKPAAGKEASSPAAFPMQIDIMKLDLGQVVFKDYTKGGEPVVTAIDARIHGKIYRNVTSAQQLATIIAVEALGPTAIKSAGIYAAATVLGVGFLPVGIAGVLVGKDSAIEVFETDVLTAYEASWKVVQRRGKVEHENKDKGMIKAAISGTSVVVSVSPGEPGKVRVKVTARRLMVPKPEIAKGILYEIGELMK